MGAGKSTIGKEVAALSGRPFIDVDRVIESCHGPIAEVFERGEPEFRRIEEEVAAEALSASVPAVIALGGGAVTSERTRKLLLNSFTLWVEVDVRDAWHRAGGSGRPLARDEAQFRRLFEERRPLYEEVSAGPVDSAEDVLLEALRISVGRGALANLEDRLGKSLDAFAVIGDEHVLEIHPLDLAPLSVHRVPRGEAAKTPAVLEQLWRELGLKRSGTIVGYGGGSTTDVAGFAAATYLRGVRWIAVPTTLLGQVDAAIGGKTAIDIPEGKNLVGVFHWPARVVLDETLLETLSERERRQGLAELVKTRLLAGRDLDVRTAAAYKAGLCLRDPHDDGVRRWLNLGHTFAHALEAAADFELPHGEAVALGLLAALLLSGRDTAEVERELAPQPVQVDPDRAWQALLRDKKRSGDAINVVLLGRGGPVVEERSDAEVRRELERLIA